MSLSIGFGEFSTIASLHLAELDLLIGNSTADCINFFSDGSIFDLDSKVLREIANNSPNIDAETCILQSSASNSENWTRFGSFSNFMKKNVTKINHEMNAYGIMVEPSENESSYIMEAISHKLEKLDLLKELSLRSDVHSVSGIAMKALEDLSDELGKSTVFTLFPHTQKNVREDVHAFNNLVLLSRSSEICKSTIPIFSGLQFSDNYGEIYCRDSLNISASLPSISASLVNAMNFEKMRNLYLPTISIGGVFISCFTGENSRSGKNGRMISNDLYFIDRCNPNILRKQEVLIDSISNFEYLHKSADLIKKSKRFLSDLLGREEIEMHIERFNVLLDESQCWV